MEIGLRDKLRVKAPVGMKPRKVRLGHAIDAVEVVCDEYFSIRLNGDCPGAREIGQVIELEGGREKAFVQRTVGMKPCKALPRCAANLRERTDRNDLAIWLQRKCADCVVCLRIEVGIHAAVLIKSAESIAGLPVDPGKQAPGKNLPIRLRQQALNALVNRARVKPGIQCPVAIQTRDVAASNSTYRHELAANQHLTVG